MSVEAVTMKPSTSTVSERVRGHLRRHGHFVACSSINGTQMSWLYGATNSRKGSELRTSVMGMCAERMCTLMHRTGHCIAGVERSCPESKRL